MKTKTKKLSSLLFIVLGLAPLFCILFFTIQKNQIREGMRKKMETHQLQTLVIPDNEVTWMDDHEIWVNEMMFDILNKKLDKGLYTFTGMYDIEETKLVKQYRDKTDEQQGDNKVLTQLFNCLPHFITAAYRLSFPLDAKPIYFPRSFLKPKMEYREIVIPPPRQDC